MAVALIATDDWIQHLVFGGGPRPTPYGPMDGVFYGLMAVAGDATGGNVTINGRLSVERKEDWVYIVGGTHTRVNSALISGDNFEQINTGPAISTGVAVTNPTFEYGGLNRNIGGNAVTFTPVDQHSKVVGMPIFGDRSIPGVFLMYAVGWETNGDTALYSAQMWGWIIRRQSFFRNVLPSVG